MFGRAASADERAVRETLAGRPDAYAELVERYLGVAIALGYSRLGTHADAEEVAQESFLRAYEGLDTLREPAKFGPWFIGIVRNCVGRVRERRGREAAYAEREGATEHAQEPEMERRELHGLVRERIDALDRSSREVVQLRYFAGQSSKEIARLLGLTPAAVRKRLERARKELGKSLLEDIAEEPRPAQSRAGKIMALVAAANVGWTVEAATRSAVAGSGVIGLKAVLAGVVAVSAVAALAYVASKPSLTEDAVEPLSSIAVPDAPVREQSEQSVSPAVIAALEPSELAATPTQSDDAPSASETLVHGLVIDWNDERVSGATVLIEIKTDTFYDRRFSDFKPVLYRGRTKTNAKGTFRFEDIPLEADGNYRGEILVRSVDGLAFDVVSVKRPIKNDHQWQLRLRPARTVIGVVKNQAGEPIAGATVRDVEFESYSARTGYSMTGLQAIRTASDGAFAMELPIDGRWRFLVTAKGYAPNETDFLDIESDDLLFHLTPGRQFTGRVEFPGGEKPEEGLVIGLSSKSQYRERHLSEVDQEGRFAFESLRPGEYGLWVDDPEFVYAGDAHTVRIPESGDVHDAIVPVARGGVIEGRLYDEDTAEGIGAIDILASRQGDHTPRPRRIMERTLKATTQDDGSFRIQGLPEGRYLLSYRPSSKLPPSDAGNVRNPGFLEVEVGQFRSGVEWPIPRRYRLAGVVVDDKGRSVQGASVRIEGVSVRIEGSINRVGGTAAGLVGFSGGGIDLAYATDALGRFTVYFAQPTEQVYLRAVKTGLASERHGPFAVTEMTTEVKVELHPSGVLAGRLVDGQGRSQQNQTMMIRGDRIGPVTTVGAFSTLVSIESVLLETLSSGRSGYFYRGDLLADRYTLATPSNSQGLTVDLGPGQIIDDIVLPLHEESAALLQGLITYLGEPLPDCFVNFGEDSVRTGPDGRFTVRADQPASSWFRASVSMDRDGMAFGRNLTAKAGSPAAQRRPVQLDFAQGSAVVEGTLFRNGEPWSRGSLTLVVLWDDGLEETIRVQTDIEGAYRFEGLPPGTHDVGLNIPTQNLARGRPSVQFEAVADRVTSQDIEVFVGSVVISVSGMLDSENAALRVIPGEIVIDAVSKEIIGQLGSEAVFHRILRGNGEVRLPDLSSGVYTVFVDSYEAPTRGIDAALETMRFTSAFFEVVEAMETEVSVVIE